MSELRIDDWSGGKTDYYINGPLNCSKTIDNFLIDRNRKPFVRFGSTHYNSTYYQIPAGNSRISNTHYFDGVLFQQCARNVYYVGGAGWNTLVGPVSSNPVFGAGTTSNFTTFANWNNHILCCTDAYGTPRKIYKDGSSVWQVRNAGLPALATDPVITPDANDSKSYIYYFFYYFTYTVGTVVFEDLGATTAILSENSADMSGTGHYNQISAIPVISNGTTECYDTANIKVKICRTEDSGVVGRYVGEVTNGTTTFADHVVDANLGAYIYTAGGVVDNDPPPQAKYLTIANDICWYANIKDGSEYKTNRVYQSLQYDPDSCPADFYLDVDSEITAISAVGKTPIIFAKDKIWRFEGYVDNLGRGAVEKIIVSDTVGCISNNGVVKTSDGLFFPSLDGFYFTNGHGVQKLSVNLNESYPTFIDTATKQKRIYGCLDTITNRIYWALQADGANSENDGCYVLDTNWGLTDRSCFTTFSGLASFRPTALAFIDGVLHRADSRGYLFKHVTTEYNDPVVNTAALPSTWASQAILYDLTSCATSFGDEVKRKYVTSIFSMCRNSSNVSVQINSCNDDLNSYKNLKEYRFRSNMLWGDEDVIWGDPEIIWNYQGVLIIKRKFPAGSLRCTYKQVQFTNAKTIIVKSDNYTTATVDASAKTFLIDDLAYTWPTKSVGYYMTVERDGYTREYLITARTASTLTVSDPDNSLVNGSQKWEMKGYKKDERLYIEAYTLAYEYFGESHKDFSAGDGGENA
jgi:hypothetical protein